jgi:hypothetical protein
MSVSSPNSRKESPKDPPPHAPLPGEPDFMGPMQPEWMLAARGYWYDETGQANLFVGDGDSHLELKPIWKKRKAGP